VVNVVRNHGKNGKDGINGIRRNGFPETAEAIWK
jgi:hypothetical protein